MRYWTSDLHFGHAKVIEYCNRPYAGLDEMHKALVANWNSVVTPDDEVMFLGDWCLHHKFYFFLKYLNFKSVNIIRGNHDRPSKLMAMLHEDKSMNHLVGKVEVHDYAEVEIGGQKFWCVHRPLEARDDIPTLCGHVHEKWKFLKPGTIIAEHSKSYDHATKKLVQPILNVGCDQHNWTPISDDQVLEYFK